VSGADDPVLYIEEVAVELRQHYQTVRRHIRTGRLRATKQGGRWFVRRSALDAFLRGDREPVAS
jgi:excisionase family DNA binding protein